MAPRRAAAKPRAAKPAKEPAAGRKRAVEPPKEHDEAREVRRRVVPTEREALPLVEHPSHQTVRFASLRAHKHSIEA